MAKTNTLNVLDYLTEDTLDTLEEVLGGVLENIQTSAVSEKLKSKNGSGDPEGGSVVYKRFANATLNAKGTARTQGKGAQVKAENVTVNLSDDKEIIEELAEKDIKLYGVGGMAEKRMANASKRVEAYLDKQFFAKAVAKGTQLTTTSTEVKDKVDEMIVNAKSLTNDFIDGIDAEDLAIVLNATSRKAMKNDLDELPNGTAPSNGLIGMYDSIEVFETNRMPSGINAMVMLKGAVAQPYYMTKYSAEKVPFDDAIALETFLYTGVEALVPEAIIYDGTVSVSA